MLFSELKVGDTFTSKELPGTFIKTQKTIKDCDLSWENLDMVMRRNCIRLENGDVCALDDYNSVELKERNSCITK